MSDQIGITSGTGVSPQQVAEAPVVGDNAKAIELLNDRLPGIIELLSEAVIDSSDIDTGPHPEEVPDTYKDASTEHGDTEKASEEAGSNDAIAPVENNLFINDIASQEVIEDIEDIEDLAEELSEIETASGSNVVLSDADEIDFGDAPTLDSFETPSPEDTNAPSGFFSGAQGPQVSGLNLFAPAVAPGGLPFGSVPDFQPSTPPTSNSNPEPIVIPDTPVAETQSSEAASQPQVITGGDGDDDAVTLETSPPEEGSSSGPVQIGKNDEDNVEVEGGGIDVELDDVEEIEVNTGSEGDSVEIGDLSDTDATKVTVNTGDGDDVVFVTDQETVGVDLNINGGEGNDTLGGSNGNDEIFGEVGDDTFFGGSGGDTLDGGDGDDSIFGNGGELLAGAHDWEVTNDIPVFSEFQTFDTAGGVSADEANYTFDNEATVTARLVSVGSGNTNAIGYYKVGTSGEITDVNFLFQANGGSTDQPGDVIDIDVAAGETLGFFIYANGVDGFDTNSGQFEIRDASGDPATTASTSTQLFFVTDTGDTALTGSLFHTNNPSMNAGGKDAAFVGFNDANAGLRIGFDDDEPFIVDDQDFNDVVIELFERAFDPNESDDDVLLGGAGNDSLFGEGGNDLLDGGEDSDTLFGGSGDDVLIGGEGSDILFGNEGDDIFQFGVGDIPTSGSDIIKDFETNGDTIFLDGILTGTVLDNLISGNLTITAVPGTGGRTIELGIDGDKTIEVNLIDDGVFSLDNLTTTAPVS